MSRPSRCGSASASASPATSVRCCGLAAELHDVGKLAIPDIVLQKAAALDATEWSFIHSHTLIGQRILSLPPLCDRSAPSSGRRTRTGTAPAIRAIGRTAPPAVQRTRSASSGVAPANSSTRTSSICSARCSPPRKSPQRSSPPAASSARPCSQNEGPGSLPALRVSLSSPLPPRRRRRARRPARAGAAPGRRSRADGRAHASGRAPCRSSRAKPARIRSRSGAR